MILIVTTTIFPHEQTLTTIVMIWLKNAWSILDILEVADCTDIDKKRGTHGAVARIFLSVYLRGKDSTR